MSTDNTRLISGHFAFACLALLATTACGKTTSVQSMVAVTSTNTNASPANIDSSPAAATLPATVAVSATTTAANAESVAPVVSATAASSTSPTTESGAVVPPRVAAPPLLQGDGNTLLVEDANTYVSACVNSYSNEYGTAYNFFFVQDANFGSTTPVKQGMVVFQTSFNTPDWTYPSSFNQNVTFRSGSIAPSGELVRYPPNTQNCALSSGDAVLTGTLQLSPANPASPVDYDSFVNATIVFPGDRGFAPQELSFRARVNCVYYNYQLAMMVPQELPCIP